MLLYTRRKIWIPRVEMTDFTILFYHTHDTWYYMQYPWTYNKHARSRQSTRWQSKQIPIWAFWATLYLAQRAPLPATSLLFNFLQPEVEPETLWALSLDNWKPTLTAFRLCHLTGFVCGQRLFLECIKIIAMKQWAGGSLKGYTVVSIQKPLIGWVKLLQQGGESTFKSIRLTELILIQYASSIPY